MKINTINSSKFCNDIEIAIQETVSMVVESFENASTNPQEPDFIASLTLWFPEKLLNILKAIYHNYKFSITGVYCHQKPIVSFTKSLKGGVELGDLLIIYRFTDKNGNITNNSLLLQAKVSKCGNYTPNNDDKQLQLYKEWKKFYYSRAGVLKGTSRNIFPKSTHHGAKYLLINKEPRMNLVIGDSYSNYLGCAIPSNTMTVDKSNYFAKTLDDFFTFETGRKFFSKPSVHYDEWSGMISDLLFITKEKLSQRKKLLNDKFPRKNVFKYDSSYCLLNEGKCYFAEELGLLNSNGIKEIDDNTLANIEGMSLIIIESQEILN